MFRSAPPHGGRLSRLSGFTRGAVFRSAPPHGGRQSPARFRCLWCVSIRAPARGATRTDGNNWVSCVFRSAPPHGGRPAARAGVLGMPMFRSAPPHGGRPRPIACWCVVRCFDPRPRTGGDRMPTYRPWGLGSFDPRPRTGGDNEISLLRGNVAVSIRAPARGATTLRAALEEYNQFRSAPPHGGRPAVPQGEQFRRDVSIRAPARGATRRANRPPW